MSAGLAHRFTAQVDRTPAAAMIMNHRAEANGAMYVQELGTLKEFRHRGIASALLREAFDVAAATQLDQVELTVDGDNADHAPAIYEQAGLRVRHGYSMCRQPMRG